MLGLFSLCERLGSQPFGGDFVLWTGGGVFALFSRSYEGDGVGFARRRHLATGVFGLLLVLFCLVVILGSGGRSIDIGYVNLARLDAEVGDPLGGSALGRVSTTGCCTSSSGIVLLDSSIGGGGDFVCRVVLQSGFLVGGAVSGGCVEGAATFGGIVHWLDDGIGGLASCLEADNGSGGLVSCLAAVGVSGWVLLGLVQWCVGVGLVFWAWACVFNFYVLTDDGPAASSA